VSTRGVEGIYIETTNWGATVAMWQALGYVLEFETDHHSGQLRHPSGGPYLFVAERGDASALEQHVILGVDDSAAFVAPSSAALAQGFEPRHWGVVEALLRDPDGRHVSLQAPLPAGVDAPPGHG
jgi:hypothetical protein